MTHEQFTALKPSELLKLAIADTKALETNERYMIDMNSDFHRPVSVKPSKAECIICFAGSVMANSLLVPIDKNTYPSAFPEPVRSRLNALDRFRSGLIDSALSYLGVQHNSRPIIQEIYVPQFIQGNDNTGFYMAMESIVSYLEAVNL